MKTPSENTPDNVPENAPENPPQGGSNPPPNCPVCGGRTALSADCSYARCYSCDHLFRPGNGVSLVRYDAPVEKCIVCGGDEPCSHDFDAMNAQEAQGFIFPVASPPENPPEDPGETPPTTESRARYEGAARFCPSCNMRTLFLVGDTVCFCTVCDHLMTREKHDQMGRPQSAEIREKILAVVDQKHGAFWGEFYDALIPAHSVEEVRLALNSLVQDGTLRMKEDDSEHDWEYRRVAASCVQPDPPTNQL